MKFKRTSITTIFECRLAKISIFIITLFQVFTSISAQKYINHNEWHAQPSRRQAPKPIPLPVIPENQLEDMLFGTDFQETSEARAAPIYIGESPGQLPPGQENYAPQNSQPREEAYLNQQQPEYFPPEVPVHSPPPRPSPRPELQPPPSSYVPKATLEGIHWSQPKNSYPSQNPQPGCNGPNCFHIPSGVSYYSPQRNAVNQDKKRPVLVISNQVKGGQNVPQSRPHVEYNVAKGLPIVQSNANYPPPNPKPFESSYGGSWDEQSSQPPQHEPAYEQPNLPPSQNYGNAPARPPAYPPTHAPPQNYFATSEKNPYELEQPRQPPYPTPPAPPPINENPYAEVPTRPPESPYPQEQETPSPREQVTPSQPEYEQPGTPAGTPPPPRYETPRATTSQPGPTPPPVYETPTEGYEQTPPIPRTSTTPSPYVESYTTTTTPSPFVEEYATTTPPQTPPRATPASTTPRQYPSTTPPYQEFSEEYPRESTEYGTTTGEEYTPSSTPPPPEREFPSTPQRPRTGTPRIPGTPRVPYPSTSPPYAPPSTTQREFPSTRSEYPTTPPRFRTPSTTPFEETTPPYEEFTSSPPYYERTRPTPPFYPPSSPRPPSPRLPSPQPPGKPPSVFVPGKPFVPQIPPFHPMRPVPPPGLPPASVATPPYGGYTTYTPPPFEGRTPTRPRPSQPPHERMVVPNRIRGKAQVVCLENGIEFKISTLFPFTGQIFSHDKKRVPECMHNFEQSYNVSVTFPFLECGVPNSGEENLQTQYHMQIIVMIEQPDKSTSIQSFMAQCVEQKVKYKKKEIPKRIEEALEELRLVPQKLEQKAPIPEVKMKIVKEVEHHKEGDGEEVDTVEIGTPLRVEWNLQPESDAYGFHVRNCIVVDIVSGAEHKVIDDKGCSTDINIFAHPHYDTYHDIARVHWHAFKVPDNSQLSIRCDIQICTDIPDASGKTSCEAIPTPPFCADLITSPMNSVLFDVEGNMVKRHVEKTRDSSSFHQRVHAEICLGNATTTECERRNVETITQEIALPKITTIQTSCPQRIWMSIATGLSTSLFIFSAGLNLYVRRRKRVDQFNLK